MLCFFLFAENEREKKKLKREREEYRQKEGRNMQPVVELKRDDRP